MDIINHYGVAAIRSEALKALKENFKMLYKVVNTNKPVIELWQKIHVNSQYKSVKLERLYSAHGDYGNSNSDLWVMYNKSGTPSSYTTYSETGYSVITPTEAFTYQDKLTAGENIIIEDNTISAKSSWALFDTIIKDHVLSYEESKGLELQGTYVYKQAIAGSRYGYADFYAKVIEEFNQATTTETVNGVTVKVHSNGHKFYDIANKTAIDEFFNAMGTAWFYGIDTANERIFLPRDNYFAVTGDVSVVGNGLALGLTDGTSKASIYIRNMANLGGSAAMQLSKAGYGTTAGTVVAEDSSWGTNARTTIGVTTDSTKSGIEGKLTSNTDKYLYICVGNTESRSSITDVVDVTTTENDTTPLFTGMYFDFTPNNASWLKGGQQANNAGIYKTCYNELVNILKGSTKYGDLKVVDTAKMTAGVDYSEYWKVNQTNMTFTTPTAISNKALSGAVVGNGMTLGLTDGTHNVGLMGAGNSTYNYNATGENLYGISIGTDISNNSGAPLDWKIASGITSDPTKSGIIAEQSTAQLYFKVANAVQNLELLDVGEVLEALADKIGRQDCKAYIIETYVSGTSGYNLYSNKYCEQWGFLSNTSNATTTVNYIKPFANTNYNLLVSMSAKADGSPTINVGWQSKTATSFVVFTYQSKNNPEGTHWRACGYIA